MRDPNDRDRQQRELIEELRHDADLRAARKRIEEEHRRADAQPEEHPVPGDQRQPSCDQPISANEVCDWAADVAKQTTGADVADTTLGTR